VHNEISSVRISLGFAAATLFVALNGSLVALWVGADRFGGLDLTVALAIHSIVAGCSYLFNSLYKATGAIARGSVLLLLESILRLPLALVLLSVAGLDGLPLAGTIVSIASIALTLHLTHKALAYREKPKAVRNDWLLWSVRIGLLAGAVVFASFVQIHSWAVLALFGFVWGLLTLASLVAIDLRLRSALLQSLMMFQNRRRLDVATA